MNTNQAKQVFDADGVKRWLGENEGTTKLEANTAEAVFRRLQTPDSPLSIEILAKLARFHGVAGNQERALAIADEMAKRDDLKGVECFTAAAIYQAAGMLTKSMEMLIIKNYRDGYSYVGEEDVSGFDPAQEWHGYNQKQAEHVALAMIEVVGQAPDRKEAIQNLALWLREAGNKDENVYGRIVIPAAILTELLSYEPNEWMSSDSIMSDLREAAPDLAIHMVKERNSIWYCGPSLAGESNRKSRSLLCEIGFNFNFKSHIITASTAKQWSGFNWTAASITGNKLIGTYEHQGVRPKHRRADVDSWDVLVFGRLHQHYGNLLRACEIYKMEFFRKPPNVTRLSNDVLFYYTLLLKAQDVDLAWLEYQSHPMDYVVTEPYYLDVRILFARKFIEKGSRASARGLLNSVRELKTTLYHKDRAADIVALLALCTVQEEVPMPHCELNSSLMDTEEEEMPVIKNVLARAPKPAPAQPTATKSAAPKPSKTPGCANPETEQPDNTTRERLRLLIEPDEYNAIEKLALRFKRPEIVLRCICRILVDNPSRFRSGTFSWRKFSSEISGLHKKDEPLEDNFIEELILDMLLRKRLAGDPLPLEG